MTTRANRIISYQKIDDTNDIGRTVHQPRRRLRHMHMFDHADLGVARVTPQSRFLMVNPGLCRLLGYTKNELLTKTTHDITHPDDRAHDAKLLKALLRGSKTGYRIDKRYLCRDGWPLWVTETSSAVKDSAGSILYRVALIQVNERKQAEEHFQLAVEAATTAMIMVDQKGKILLVNSQTEALFGYSREELLGKPSETILAAPSQGHRSAFATLSSYLDNRLTVAKWDVYGKRRNGTYFHAELGMTPVHTREGTWILSSIVDVARHGGQRTHLQKADTFPILRIQPIVHRASHKARSTLVGVPQTG
jgi:PAS domain S-box-containing protein